MFHTFTFCPSTSSLFQQFLFVWAIAFSFSSRLRLFTSFYYASQSSKKEDKLFTRLLLHFEAWVDLATRFCWWSRWNSWELFGVITMSSSFVTFSSSLIFEYIQDDAHVWGHYSKNIQMCIVLHLSICTNILLSFDISWF